MDYRTSPLKKYLDDAGSNAPAPGGGSVSALAGALGTAMGCMVANFTLGKKKYAQVEERVKELLSACDKARNDLLDLAQADVDAYGLVSAAYKMPKDTPEQKTARTEAIQKALVKAMEVPLKTLRICAGLMDAFAELGRIGNKNLISDVGVAAILAEAALRGAKMNVEINLAGLNDEELVREVQSEVDASMAEAAAAMKDIVSRVERRIRK